MLATTGNVRVPGSVGRQVDCVAAVVCIAIALSPHLLHGTVATLFRAWRAYKRCIRYCRRQYFLVQGLLLLSFGYFRKCAVHTLCRVWSVFRFQTRPECCTRHRRSLFRSGPTRKIEEDAHD